MEKRVKNSVVFIVSLSLIISYAFMILGIYTYCVNSIKSTLISETDYIRASLEVMGDDYLQYLDNVRTETRITKINQEGFVTYDSGKDETLLENHKDREEVVEAIQEGTGSSTRVSDTVGENMMYYAVRMNDGTIIRAAKSMDSVWKMAFHYLPYMLFIGVGLIVIAWALTKKEVKKLVYPINTLDLEDPLSNEVYEELQPLLEKIDKQNKAKDEIANMRREFSANVSHELKTPLTSISGYAELMTNGMVRPDDMQEFSKRIYDEASRMITLVGDIIRLSKLDEGNLQMEKENVDLYHITRETINRLALQAEKKEISIELQGMPTVVLGVRPVLGEMIYNVCENAIKYNKIGGKVSIWVGDTLTGKKVIIRDTGIGIAEADYDRIFERFYRVDKSHSKETGGTGLGLSIVKHGAKLHNAEVLVESKEGEGTTIQFVFPSVYTELS